MQKASTIRRYVEGILAPFVQSYTSISRRLADQLNYVVSQAGVSTTADTRLYEAIATLIGNAVNVVENRVFVDNAAFSVSVVDGDPVYWDNANAQFDQAVDDGTAANKSVGLADVTASQVTLFGEHTAGLSGLSIGSGYYLDDVTPGGMSTTVRPNAPRLGTAKSATSMFVDIDRAPGRLRLTADLVLYVSTTGSDTADGLTIGAPMATIAHALTSIYDNYDLAGYGATIQLADGTYTEQVAFDRMVIGGKNAYSITLAGNAGSPANVILSGNGSSHGVFASAPVNVAIKDMTIGGVVGGSCIYAEQYANVYGTNLIFGTTDAAHVAAIEGAKIIIDSYEITGGALYHWYTSNIGMVSAINTTVTVANAVTFVNAFAYCQLLGSIECYNDTFINPGNVTGARYYVQRNGVIQTNGAGATYIPGSAAGTALTGGLYI